MKLNDTENIIGSSSRNRLRRIAVTEFRDSRSTWYRQILEGVEQYVAANRGWEVRLIDADEREPEQLTEWGIDGAILFASAVERLDRWLRLCIPLVNVASRYRNTLIPTVAADNHAIGKLAAEYLFDRGFKRLGMVTLKDHEASELRREGFTQAVEKRGSLNILEIPPGLQQNRLRDTRRTDALIERWLEQQTLPVGIFGWNDPCATMLIQSCQRLGISVPEQAAVIGCDNDEVWCGLCTPTLTSIQPPSRQIGHEAARLLDSIITRSALPEKPKLLPPIGISERGSTDVLACDDPLITNALKFIRSRHDGRITVGDVVAIVGVSRRNLERRFQEVLGRSPLEEIHRHHMSRAKELLQRTDLSLEEIAERSGFRDAGHLIRLLSKDLGETPTQYRNRYRNM